MSLSEVVEGW